MRRHAAFELLLHLQRRLAGREAGAVTDAEDMGVHRDGRLAEGCVEDDIGRLAADAGQALQRLAAVGHGAAMLSDENLREPDDIARLGVEQPDSADVVAHTVHAEREHGFRRVGGREEAACRLVDARIGRLGRQHDGYQQRIGVDVVQLALRLRQGDRQAVEEGLDLRLLHAFGRGVRKPTMSLISPIVSPAMAPARDAPSASTPSI